MTWHRVGKYIPMKSPVATYKRREQESPRVFKVGELDGFYVDTELDKAVHITFDDQDIMVIDVYDTAQAAYNDTGEVLGITEINLRTGKARFFNEER